MTRPRLRTLIALSESIRTEWFGPKPTNTIRETPNAKD